MLRYVCRKDHTDLTPQVEEAVRDEGYGLATSEVFVEAPSEDRNFSGGKESFISPDAARESDDLMRIEVICPTDDVPNVFWVRPPGD